MTNQFETSGWLYNQEMKGELLYSNIEFTGMSSKSNSSQSIM